MIYLNYYFLSELLLFKIITSRYADDF